MRHCCRFFETFSYLPPMTDEEISKQVDYIIRQGWIPCLEFSESSGAYIKEIYNIRFSGTSAGYYDNRCASLYLRVRERVVRQPCSAGCCDWCCRRGRLASCSVLNILLGCQRLQEAL